MAITFRNVKNSPLTHDQMDTNLASYYLSSSVSGSTLTFYRSGSDLSGSVTIISSSHTLTDSSTIDTGSFYVSSSVTANTLTFLQGDGTTEAVDLSLYIDDTNLAYIVAGVYDTGSESLIFTRNDSSSFSVDASVFLDNTNLVTSVNNTTGSVELDLQDVCDVNSTTSTTIEAANFITTSDKRLKSDIKPIQEGLETIKKFISYEYVKDGVQDAGFLAQEVQEAIPYSIGEREDGFLTMRDRPVLAHMHKAILELEARLAAIEEKLQ